jgi:hypothetical protein
MTFRVENDSPGVYVSPRSGTGMCILNFILTYKGVLTSNADKKQKHSIREQLSPQLEELWTADPLLKRLGAEQREYRDENGAICDYSDTKVWIADSFKRGDSHFLPLVTRRLKLICDLDITFLRRDGDLIKGGGDLDNRIKTLFDALRVPDISQLVEGESSTFHKPQYCLLEDDSLIAGFRIKPERLLVPSILERPLNEVQLSISVRVGAVDLTSINRGFSRI